MCRGCAVLCLGTYLFGRAAWMGTLGLGAGFERWVGGRGGDCRGRRWGLCAGVRGIHCVGGWLGLGVCPRGRRWRRVCRGPRGRWCVLLRRLVCPVSLLVGVANEIRTAIRGSCQPEHVILWADYDGSMCGCGAASLITFKPHISPHLFVFCYLHSSHSRPTRLPTCQTPS